MKLRKIISGGQTGADQEGLKIGKELGLKTGGTCPADWRTDEGPACWLANYGLVCHSSTSYSPRTYENVKNSSVTVWFGETTSPGFLCTKKACKIYGRMLLSNPAPHNLVELAEHFEIFNVAGNRRRTNPKVADLVQYGFSHLRGLIKNHT